MATYVIVHGGFGGGWEWTPAAQELRANGHVVYTPTLTGMGERGHAGPRVGLGTHVRDVTALIEFEDLGDVVLCGASYGGVPVTGAADQVAGRIRLVVYIDALIPRDGQSVLDLLPESFAVAAHTATGEQGDGWVHIPEALLPPAGWITEEDRARYVARLCPQPAVTFIEPIHLTGAVDRLPRAFLRCTAGEPDVAGDPIEPMAARARAEGWLYRELHAPHDPQLFDPVATAATLHELSRSAPDGAVAHGDLQPSPSLSLPSTPPPRRSPTCSVSVTSAAHHRWPGR